MVEKVDALEWIDAVVSAGSIRGPYTMPMLPSLGRTLREESWPLPLSIRSLKLRELAVIERRAMDNEKKKGRGILCLFGF